MWEEGEGREGMHASNSSSSARSHHHHHHHQLCQRHYQIYQHSIRKEAVNGDGASESNVNAKNCGKYRQEA